MDSAAINFSIRRVFQGALSRNTRNLLRRVERDGPVTHAEALDLGTANTAS